RTALAVGADPRLPDPFPWASGRRIAYVGRLRHDRGVDLLLRAMALVRTAGARLLVAGDGPARSELQSLTDRLGLWDRVVLRGPMRGADAAALLDHIDA